MDIIFSVVITAIIYLAGGAALLLIGSKKPELLYKFDINRLIKRSAFVFAVNEAALLLCCVFTHIFTFVETPISLFACSAVSILVYLAFVFAPFTDRQILRKSLKSAAILFIIPFLLEIFIFNAKSITTDKKTLSPSISSFTTSTPNSVTINASSIVFNSNGSVDIEINQEGLRAVDIEFSGNSSSILNCCGMITDDNLSLNHIIAGEKQTSPSYGCRLTMEPYGTLHSFRIELSNLTAPTVIEKVTFSSALPFVFSDLRFFIISCASVIIFLICRLRLYRAVFDFNNISHKIIIAAALSLCLASVFLFLIPNQTPVSYQPSQIEVSDQYIQQFDAIYNGQANLNISTSPQLAQMTNPYDGSLRDQSNVSFSWDRAYYNGKYYSYFGAVPVLVFYFPFYFLTGKLPTMNMTSIFFAALAIIFFFGAVLTAVKKFIKKPNFLILLLGLITGVAVCGIYYSLDFSNIYFSAVISSQSFLLLCIWCGLAAYKQKSIKKQAVLLLLSGIGFILCVGCRPTMALGALILAPVFIYFLVNGYAVKRKLICAFSFLLPVIIGMAALMWYNLIRFDSPFEFGSSYQLTVSNMSANTVRFTDIAPALIQYFLQPPAFTPQFPHISLSSVPLANYGRYVYCDTPMSLLNFPSIMLALIILPFILKRSRASAKRLKAESNIKFFTYLLIPLISVAVIWIDYCMAGTAIRYLLDALPILTLLSILVFLEATTALAQAPSIQSKGTLVFSASMLISSAMVFLHLLTFTTQALFKRFPDILFETERLLEFWC